MIVLKMSDKTTDFRIVLGFPKWFIQACIFSRFNSLFNLYVKFHNTFRNSAFVTVILLKSVAKSAIELISDGYFHSIVTMFSDKV